jgi:DNA-binding Xre family transcriptional regulator
VRITWRVREIADDRGVGPRQLAAAAGRDEKTVRNILAGRAKRVDLETIARLAEALAVTPGALWRTSPSPDWERTAGAAGTASREEIEAVLGGGWAEPDPGLERAHRTL